ncbi:GGDEF domain-containing protein [Cellulomonas fimi]|uniref:GGDEF domain-containing protein n=1 Tax=Cellulomonas fimi TaxID=1708 RepID=A0A7Y0M2Q7_CELFI|nr:GGDEF domain-containing protein [Cellulomonas fimi]NMR21412.1 GGDEF domain-containing protein [Cellulomonas fimi]
MVGTVLLVGAVTARNVGSLRRAATIDHLTGALNRSGLEVAATIVLAAAHRHGAPLAVVMVDLDGFKRVNDTLGHAAGDRLLADLVDGWRERLREQDLAARIGGDEFVLVLPDTDAAGAEAVVVELARDAPTPWTAGVAVAGPQDTLDSLVRRADRELYRRKRSAGAVEGPAGAVEG